MCTYLLGLSPTDVKFPLAQFQATKSDDKDDTKKLLHTINGNLGERSLKESLLEDTFDLRWPALDRALRAIPSTPAEDKRAKRASGELLEEILQLSRVGDKKSDMALQVLNDLATTGGLERLLQGRVIPRFGFRSNMSDFFPVAVEPGTGTLRMDAAASGFASTEEVAQLAAQQANKNAAAIAADTASKKKDGEK